MKINLRNVYVLTNSKFVGDKNQSIGVVSALTRKLKPLEIKLIELDEEKLTESEINKFIPNDLVIAAGDHGVQAIKKINTVLPASHPISILTGHQFFSEFKTLESKHYPTITGFPQVVLAKEEMDILKKNSIFVSLVGVPHQVTPETVNQDLKAFESPPNLSGKVPIGIILGGDAPDHKTGLKKFFTPDDARKRIEFIVNDLKNSKHFNENTLLIITNGPRTGQHNYLTQVEIQPNPHKAKEMDEVSKAVLEHLETKLGISTAQIAFYNFDYSAPSAYKPLLFWIASHKSFMYVPAESVSMVTESDYVVRGGGSVIVYTVSSENASHTQINQLYFKSGVIDLLDEKGEHHRPIKKAEFSTSTPTDAEKMADQVMEMIMRFKLSLTSSLVSPSSSVQSESTDPKNIMHFN